MARSVAIDDESSALSIRITVLSTVAFTVCFAAWVINGVLIASLQREGITRFSESEVAWLLAVPILTGALSRVPLGLLTDRFGGRVVLTIVMLVVAVPMFLLSRAETYNEFFLASLGFGLAGGAFAVGVGFVSVWTSKARQGMALGIFGMGNAGAAATTLVAPTVLANLADGDPQQGWRVLPQAYAALLVVTALVFFALTKNRKPAGTRTLGERLKPLRQLVVWRFGLYYFLMFGGFVALAQWIVPYGVSVYGLTVVQAGFVASAFSLPSGVIRAFGGWLSDRFGARTVTSWVLGCCLVVCLLLSVPRMDVVSPGQSVVAKPPGGEVTLVQPDVVRVGNRDYRLVPDPGALPAETDDGSQWLPSVTSWHEPVVRVGDRVAPKALVARGVSHIYYPANVWIFIVLVVLIGVATGIGKAAVYKFIPDHFPNDVGAVGGMVGLLGALGGFVLPPVFGFMLDLTGLWSTCWLVLAFVSAICLMWMYGVVRRLMKEEAPELAEMMERGPSHALDVPVDVDGKHADTLEQVLATVPFFSSLTPEELKGLAEIGDVIDARAGEAIFKQGDPGDALYVVLRGQVRAHRSDDEGNDRELATFAPGQFFGELALIDGEPRSATVTALADSRFFLIGRKEFLRRITTTPRMLADLLVGLSTALRRTSQRSVQPASEPK